jgi:hypothetical protein
MSSLIEANQKLTPSEKADKLSKFLNENEKTLNGEGVQVWMEIKNHILDLLRKIERSE